VVHQEIHQWCKFGESITFISKDITVFHKVKWNYGQTDGLSKCYMTPDLSDQGHKNMKHKDVRYT